MDNDLLGGMQDLAHLQDMSENGAVEAQPQGIKNVDEMEDGEFLEYLDCIKNGEKPFEEGKASDDVNNVTDNTEAPFKTFATQEDYQKDFDKKFSRRHNGLKDLLNIARESYGDLEESELISRMKNDMVSAAAAQSGKSPEDFQSEMELRQKAEAYDRMMQGENDKREVIDRWMKEAESLKEIHPDFDLEKALENPQFMESLTRGKSVAESFISTMASQRQAPARAIRQNASQVSSGSVARRDPAKMSDAEFEKYISDIKGNI